MSYMKNHLAKDRSLEENLAAELAEEVEAGRRARQALAEARGLLREAASKLHELDGYSGANFVDLGIGIDGTNALADIDAFLAAGEKERR